ncbi:MAG: HEAT repeat domain-containing protein [Bacteroidales bacterium]
MATDQRDIGGFTVDASQVVRAWDPWMARITGIPAHEAKGRPMRNLVPGAEARGLVALVAEVIADGTVRVLAAALHRFLIPCPPQRPSAHFDQMQQHVTIGPLREGNRILGAIITIEDVTARLDRERDLAARHEAGQLAGTDAEGPAEPDAFRAALRGDDWRVRRRAADAMARPNGSELISALLAALRDEHQNFAVVSSALQLLSQLNLDVVGPLVDFLQSPDADLRIQATLGLGEQADARAVPALLTALDDPDANVKFHAIEALGKLRAVEAVDRLLETARSADFFLAFAAIDALAQINDARTAPLLMPLLDDRMLRSAVIDALGKTGDESTVAPLARLLDRADAPSEAIAQALVSLQARSIQRHGEGALVGDLLRQHVSPAGVRHIVDAVGSAHGEGLRALAIVLGWLEGGEVERTLARLLGHASARREVVEGLVRFGPRVTDLLVQQLAAEDPETQQAAVIALGRIGDRRATRPLLDLMERNRDTILTAAGALAMIGDASAFERLFAFVADEDAAVRQGVIAALNSIGHPSMGAHARRLLDSPDPRARESAVKIAGYFGYAQCIDALIARCRDEDEEVRRAALEHLPFLDDPRVVPTLVTALAEDTPRARSAAAHALGRVEDQDVGGPLLEALRDADSWVRYFAVRAVGQHRMATAVDTISGILRTDPAMHVRLAAIEALGAIGSEEAVAALAPLCGETGDLASAALRALGGVGHKAAWPPLREALKADDPRQKTEAIRAVSACGGEEAPTLLEWAAAASADPAIIREAIQGLARLGSTSGPPADDAVDALVRLTSDPAQRERAVAALGALPASASDRVAAGLADPRPHVRCAVVEALGRMRHQRATARLRTALDDTDAEVRSAAIGALTHLGSRGLDTRLAALARSDPDAGVRRAARSALGSGPGHAPGRDQTHPGPADGDRADR